VLLEELARGGTEVRFVRGRQSETPEDELLLQFQGMIAEYEKAQIIERTRRGKLHRHTSCTTIAAWAQTTDAMSMGGRVTTCPCARMSWTLSCGSMSAFC